jgi:two-component system, LytTR family, sensor kinase
LLRGQDMIMHPKYNFAAKIQDFISSISILMEIFSFFAFSQLTGMQTEHSDIKQPWYSAKWAQIIIHSLVWITLFSLPFAMRPSNDPHRAPSSDEGLWHIHYILQAILLICFFYLNARVLIPKLIYRGRYWNFAAITLLLYATVPAFRIAFTSILIPKDNFELRPTLLFSFFVFTFILACSTAWRMIRDRIAADQLASDRENENLKTELTFLRSQVSPHFMFNVLNNMVALARKKSDQLEPSLIKLSSLMRYMLYETDEEKVPLDKETDYLQSYIDLQQQRFGAKVAVNVVMQLPEHGYEIEPMLLIPFVENAFKHGTGLIPDARIDIELRAKQGLLQFSVMNKYNTDYAEVKDKTSGIGLTNVKRRLNLLYKDNYQLLINKQEGWFIVSLQLQLH